jgi:phospho-N-acetylmuramoyl-pentapeptide-transferase
MIIDIVKVILPAILTFSVGILITPYITNYLYKNQMWKKKAKEKAIDGRETPIFNKLHGEKEINTPRMGGSVIWISAFIVGALIWLLARITDIDALVKIEFISRNQTWIPFFTLLLGAFIGIFDDILEIKGKGKYVAGGLSLKFRLTIISIIGLLIGAWFYIKLGVDSIGVPFYGDLYIGWLILPLYILVLLAIYSGGVIDGLDGLSGGVFAAIYSAYGIIAFSLNQIDLAAFAGLIVGGILAFLWFNIPPARFYMTETGSMALTITLGVMAFMTDSLVGGVGIFILPIIAAPLLLTALSVIIQVLSKKFRNGKKVFLVAPLHHHFEAIGWPAYKVTMRYWIISVVFASTGIIIALIA